MKLPIPANPATSGRPRTLSIVLTLLLISAAVQPVAALDTAALREVLSSSDRELSDRIRDEFRKPVEVLDFIGVEPGQTVLDVYAAGGYYTVVLAKAVGINGTVYAQNTPRGLRYEEDRMEISQGDALAAKIRDNNLINVVRKDMAVNDLDIPEGSLDVIMIAQILHDYYNGSPARARRLLQTLRSLLKPGGIVAVIDHVGIEGQDNRRLHRMRKEDAIAVAEQAGFRVEAQSDILMNGADNPLRSIFDPMLNRNTDRFVLRLRKPE